MVSETGLVKRAPTPKPIKKSPVASDSVTSETPKSALACFKAAESILLANPTTQPIAAIRILEDPRQSNEYLRPRLLASA